VNKKEISILEVEKAIKSLKKAKSPGSDNITSKMLENGGNIIKRALTNLIQCWNSKSLPKNGLKELT